jgi:hypothetical protein
MTTRTYTHNPASACRHRHVDALGKWASEKTHQSSARDEAGAVLILALAFLLVVGMITGGLAGWITNDLNNSTQFTSARSLQSSASNATELAIQSIRYDPLLATTQDATPPAPCWGTGSSSDVSLPEGDTTSDEMSVWCSTKWNPYSASTRVVTISTCLSSRDVFRQPLPPGHCCLRRLPPRAQRTQSERVRRVLRNGNDGQQLAVVTREWWLTTLGGTR